MKPIQWTALVLFLAVSLTIFGQGFTKPVLAGDMNPDIVAALDKLYSKSEAAATLAKAAKGILVFPEIVKGGFLVGGQYGEGGLIIDGKQTGHYNTIQVSYGLQAGLQKYGYAMFFMSDSALGYIDKSNGLELGVGPTVVVVDDGASKSFTTTTARAEIYVFFFDQKGLMAGLGIQGTKITKID